MRSSKWHALGNTYLLVEEGELTPARALELVGDADGIVEVLAASDIHVDVRIWNRDGSPAEMSGNATRIAARWLAGRSAAAEVVVRVGAREVRARGGSVVVIPLTPGQSTTSIIEKLRGADR